MAKDITIQEDGIDKTFSDIMRVRTNGTDGTDEWIPEDETHTILKTIRKNGTYLASEDGVYGYYALNVKVKASSVTGKDKHTGETIKVIVDSFGNIIKIPANTIGNVVPGEGGTGQ
jgi:hypothetical protein